MSRYAWIVILALVMSLSSCITTNKPSHSQEAQALSEQAKAIEPALNQVKIQEMQLAVAERESELKFKQEMQKLEIERKHIELERERKAGKHGMPSPEMNRCRNMCEREPGCKWQQEDDSKGIAVFLAFGALINILLSIWVYTDLRQRKTGSGLWIALTLLTGFLGAMLYALARIGDKQAQTP